MKEKIELMPYEREVFYYETDKMGIVHHSNYVKWLEEARNNFMVQIGYPFDKVENENLMVPVLDVYCKYINIQKYNGDTAQIYLGRVNSNGVLDNNGNYVNELGSTEFIAVGGNVVNANHIRFTTYFGYDDTDFNIRRGYE